MDNSNKNILSSRLIQLRKLKGLSQYALAEKLGYSRGLISNYEQGRREPDYNTLKTIASFFDVSTDYLLGNAECKNSPFNNDSSSKKEKNYHHLDVSDLDQESIQELLRFKELLKLKQEVDKSKDETSVSLTRNA